MEDCGVLNYILTCVRCPYWAKTKDQYGEFEKWLI